MATTTFEPRTFPEGFGVYIPEDAPEEPKYEDLHPIVRERSLDTGKYSLKKYLPDVRDQGNRGTCVAHAVTTVISINHGLDLRSKDQRKIEFAPDFVYAQRSYQGSGMYIPNALQIINTLGCCLEKHCPYNSGVKKTDDITDDMRENAYHFRTKSHSQVTTLEGMIDALKHNKAIITAFSVYDQSKEHFYRPIPGKEREGLHAVVIYEVDLNQKCFWFQNSWSKFWNLPDKGCGKYTFEDWTNNIRPTQMFVTEDTKGTKPVKNNDNWNNQECRLL